MNDDRIYSQPRGADGLSRHLSRSLRGGVFLVVLVALVLAGTVFAPSAQAVTATQGPAEDFVFIGRG